MLRSRGEVREPGLIGVTRNHVCPRGTGGSNPPLSAIESTQIEISYRTAELSCDSAHILGLEGTGEPGEEAGCP
jgi:hypothetical protein